MADIAVLTGDIVGSSALPAAQLEKAMTALSDGASRIASWEGLEETRFSRVAGDGWQLALPRPAVALRALLLQAASLRAASPPTAAERLSTRISLAIAPAPWPAPADLNSASGAAFTLSGRGLQHIGRAELFTFSGTEPPPLAAAVLSLVEPLTTGWSATQADALVPMLAPDPPGQARLAEARGQSRQSLHGLLSAAHLDPLLRAIAGWEQAWEPLRESGPEDRTGTEARTGTGG